MNATQTPNRGRLAWLAFGFFGGLGVYLAALLFVIDRPFPATVVGVATFLVLLWLTGLGAAYDRAHANGARTPRDDRARRQRARTAVALGLSLAAASRASGRCSWCDMAATRTVGPPGESPDPFCADCGPLAASNLQASGRSAEITLLAGR